MNLTGNHKARIGLWSAILAVTKASVAKSPQVAKSRNLEPIRAKTKLRISLCYIFSRSGRP